MRAGVAWGLAAIALAPACAGEGATRAPAAPNASEGATRAPAAPNASEAAETPDRPRSCADRCGDEQRACGERCRRAGGACNDRCGHVQMDVTRPPTRYEPGLEVQCASTCDASTQSCTDSCDALAERCREGCGATPAK